MSTKNSPTTNVTGIVQPSGPSIQFGRCSGLVQASKTSARGAAIEAVCRVIREAVGRPPRAA